MAVFTYTQIFNGNVNLVPANFIGHTPPVPSLGGDFVAQCVLNGLSPAISMPLFFAAFNNLLLNNGCIWNPRRSGNSYLSGAALLDRALADGECAYPANALALLINAPAPYGFGVGGATVVPYSGVHNEGFISAHGVHLPGPVPNIKGSNFTTVLPGFYCWPNHKVVTFNGVFYDPNYLTTYPNAAAMATADLQVVRTDVRLRDLESHNIVPNTTAVLSGLRLAALKVSDLVSRNVHDIDVYQATNVLNPALTGYYVEWGERWANMGYRKNIYGPYANNPLVR